MVRVTAGAAEAVRIRDGSDYAGIVEGTATLTDAGTDWLKGASALYAFDGDDYRQLLTQSTSVGNLRVALYEGTTRAKITDAMADAVSDPNGLWVGSTSFEYNGVSLDMARANQEFVGLASAARTASAFTANIVNHDARGVIVVFDRTVDLGSGTLQCRVQGIDLASGKTHDILNGPMESNTGTTAMYVYPGIPESTGLLASRTLPRVFKVIVDADTSGSWTYSVGISLLK